MVIVQSKNKLLFCFNAIDYNKSKIQIIADNSMTFFVNKKPHDKFGEGLLAYLWHAKEEEFEFRSFNGKEYEKLEVLLER